MAGRISSAAAATILASVLAGCSGGESPPPKKPAVTENSGLGPGRFEVSVGGIMDSPVLYHGTIEVDGVNDATISIDLK
jgi:hypothetical protein